jgi:hypothetical protein
MLGRLKGIFLIHQRFKLKGYLLPRQLIHSRACAQLSASKGIERNRSHAPGIM